MHTPPSDYAPDLEWMLQSGQVSQETLLEALTSEYYPGVFHLAFATLDNRRAARQIAGKVFARALLELHRYRPQQGIELWLYRLALEECASAHDSLERLRKLVSTLPFLTNFNLLGDTLPENEVDAEIWLAVDGLETSLRQVLILGLLMDWQPATIEALTGNSAEAASDAIHEIQKTLQAEISPAQPIQGGEQPPISDEFVATLKASLEKRWLPVRIHQPDQRRILAQINRRTRAMQTRRRGVFSALESSLVVLIILVGAGIAWGMNFLGETQATPSPALVTLETVLVTKIVHKNVTVVPGHHPADPISTGQPHNRLFRQYTVKRTGERLEDLAKKLNIPPDSLRELNRLPDDVILEAGQRLLLPGHWDPVNSPPPTPVQRKASALPLEDPYPADLVHQRLVLEETRYNTLWVDARVIDYGPLSYIGPPGVFQAQLWESREQSLDLIGYAGQLPQAVELRIGNSWQFTRPQANPAWFSEWGDTPETNSPSFRILLRMKQTLFDRYSLEDSRISVSGREEQAGVQALVLEVFNEEGLQTDRIWYDDSRGMILRRIIFHPGEELRPIFEVQVASVAYDFELPPGLFDARLPWRGGFASDSSGAPADIQEQPPRLDSKHVRFNAEPAPLNFDRAQSRLLFQFPPFYSPDSPPTIIELLADGYSLRPVLFGNPWQTLCQRSPDGNWLAYVSIPAEENAAREPLIYFNLADPAQSYTSPNSEQGVTDFAFSPDSRRLAYFIRPGAHGNGTLSIIDLATHQNKPVLSIGDVKSLVWSPDGERLAMISRASPDTYLENVTIFDVETEQITYNAPLDLLSHSAGDWLVLDWGVEFPVEMGNLDACSKPPLS